MKRILITVVAVALSLHLATVVFAGPITGISVPELSQLDDIMTGWMEENGLNSATLAVKKDNRLVYERGFGYQDENLCQPTRPDAMMRLATPSVTFTKRALKQLVENGMLNATDPVYQVVDLTPWQGSFADPRMQQIKVQHLLDDTSCLADAPSVQDIGLWMGLGRNATIAESIRYQWSNPNAMRDVKDPNDKCTIGSASNSKISHYAYEMAAYIIAKTWNPDLDNTVYDAVGTVYGDYVNYQVGAPIDSVLLQWQLFDSYENEVWYDSDGDMCPAQWNRNWDPAQSEVLCAYSVDSFARPGSGTIVSSGRDVLNYLNHYSLWTAEAKPESLVGWKSYIYALYGELPGTQSVIREGVDATTGESVAYVMLANKVNPGAGESIDNTIRTFLADVEQWPAIDLFDSVYECTATTAGISDHITAGRVYSQSDSGGCDPVVTYYASGSDENLGEDPSLIVTLKEDPPQYFSPGPCSAQDAPPVITLAGDNPLTITLGSPYIEPGYSAMDDVDGDLTDQVVVTGGVDPNTAGTYYKSYDVTDTGGKAAQTAVRTIYVESTGPQCHTTSNANHVAAGRAYALSDTSGCDPVVTYYAVGSDETIGERSTTVVTLKEDPKGYFVQSTCP